MNPSTATRTGFSLAEAIAAILILAVSIPTTVSMLTDAASARIDASHASRATWYATIVMEHIIADAASASPELGMDGFSDAAAYLDNPGTGLNSRIASIIEPYTDAGFAHAVNLRTPVAADGLPTGQPDLDAYRYVTVTISWTSPRRGATSMSVSVLVSEAG